MQALSVWPPKGGFLVVPRLEYEVGSVCPSSTSERRGRKRWCLVGTDFYCKNYSPFTISGNSSCCWSIACYKSSHFGVRTGFQSHSSKLRHVFFSCEPNKGVFSSSFALAWASAEQAVGSELPRLESSSDDGLSGEVEADDADADCHQLESQSNDNDGGEETGKLDPGSQKEVGEKGNERVDVRALTRSLHFAKTADDIEEVLKDKADLPLQVHSTMIKALGRDNKLEPALALVEWLKRKKKETGSHVGPNHFIYNTLLSALRKCGQYGEAGKIINDMTQEGFHPNSVTYNTLMMINIEQGEASVALDIMEEMQKKGIALGAASYSTALLAHRNLEDGNGAVNLFAEISAKYRRGELGKGSDDNWDKEFVKLEDFTIRICYLVMRRWLTKNENTGTKVLKLLSHMDKARVHFRRTEYERLIWACTREQHYFVAKELYARIREKHVGISLSVCNHLIWLMGKAKKWWAALEIYEDLLDKGPKPNNLSCELILSYFNYLLDAAKKRGIWKFGIRLLDRMQEKGLKPGIEGWNAALIACSRASEPSAALDVFRRMLEQGKKPTNISYRALLCALEKGQLYDEAVRVWEHMLKVGVGIDKYSYTIMASVFSGMGKFREVDAIIQEMTSSGTVPDVVTYNAIISACARKNMSSAAYEWFHRMRVQSISPDNITYEMLIEGLAKDGKSRLAYELYLRARDEGLVLASKAYDAVVRSSHEQEAYDAVVRSSNEQGDTIDFLLGPQSSE
ncbi:hypothetical protein Tsubulata_018665 [Turnera subulata]|uniref:Pentacotripeptide-repeat region of PRORP domain-containing protein n=1 Tax=Turnera subulata TaxID=218843 RepID=A0A9Q0F8W6_9ROSI|nr:hypothetical protein Tsubulata_018665 [Turnera subulata]